jgi:hypothetical protein
MVEELLERVDEIIGVLQEDEEKCYVALDVAHQLRDELVHLIPEETPDE